MIDQINLTSKLYHLVFTKFSTIIFKLLLPNFNTKQDRKCRQNQDFYEY